jgi:predicted nuclease with TOPRIM domain
MEKLKKDIALIAASLEALGANVKASTEDQKRMAEDQKRMAEDQKRMAEDMDRMAARGRLMDEDLQSLKGPFASLGEHLIRFFERDAEMRAWREHMEARVEALERKQPPAA